MKILIIFQTGIERIEAPIFENYIYIEEIEIFDLPELTYVNENAISHLTSLRKFSIRRCTKLTEADGTFLVNTKKIQSLILRNNGLDSMPYLKMTNNNTFRDVEVDLSGNHIEFIASKHVVDVRAKTLKLSNNRIKRIDSNAFNGSSFVNLLINDNKDLESLKENTFNNIKNLYYLNLSNTAITSLPINGLKKLKGLYLENVPTLKKLPSVLNFTDLSVTHLTYPHHCCLFKYVDTVDFDESGVSHTSKVKEKGQRKCDDIIVNRKQIRKQKPTTQTTKKDDLQAFFDMMGSKPFSQTSETNPEVQHLDDDEDLPPFTRDQIGVSKCNNSRYERVKNFANILCTPSFGPLNPCENIVGYPFLQKAIWGAWILAIVGNVLVWIVLGLAYEKRMRLHYLYMVNMSLADMCVGVYLAILAIEDYRTAEEYYRFAVAWQTGFGCNIAGFLAVFGTFLSIISMFLIAFEMSYNARQAFYGKRLSQFAGVGLIVGAWIFSLIMACLPLIGVSSYSETSICLPLRVKNYFDRSFIIFGLLFNLIAFIAMVGCYAFIIYMLKENRNSPSREEDKALITKMALLVITDFICWFPTIFFGLFAALGKSLLTLSESKIFLVFFFPINCVSNPFLYVFFTKIVQRNLKAKTMPVLKRITSPSFTNPLSVFYNNQPPNGDRRGSQQHSRLAVTQTTSLNSTPRGSNCSSIRSRSSFESNRKGSSPRVSFQDEQIPLNSPPVSPTRKFISSAMKRVSVVPEVSDVSEHSSESHHEHVPRQKKKMRFSLHRFGSRSPKTEERHPTPIPNSGQDSGRGSLASSVDTYTSQDRSSQNHRDSRRISVDESQPHIIFPYSQPPEEYMNTCSLPSSSGTIAIPHSSRRSSTFHLSPPTIIAETPPPRRFSLNLGKNYHCDSIPLLIVSDYGQDEHHDTQITAT
ncbi:hypothetical protein WR25_07020 [Diploscapter pachys]|uniref:G-protein coupled receptors family 1 profile domain-containing protein n=1 Tax=Diploscapter pachys TaxID=2018661 RepID=A0A2A2JS94_9BILA|nr:hypothetical protein WR25_07020 [Diploscapter pachys]